MGPEFHKIFSSKESNPELGKPENPLMGERLGNFLRKEIHEIKGEKNPKPEISREELLKEAVKVGIITEKKEEEKGKKEKKKEIFDIEEIAKLKNGERVKINIEELRLERGEVKINQKGRPAGIQDLIGKSGEKYPLIIEFPKYSDERVKKIIEKQEPIFIHQEFIKETDKKRKPILFGRFNPLAKIRKELTEQRKSITKEIIEKRVEKYTNFIEGLIRKGEIKEEDMPKEEAEREILSFMLAEPLDKIEKEVKEKLFQEEIKKGGLARDIKLKKETIIDLILGEKTIEGIGKEDLEIATRYETILHNYLKKLEKIVFSRIEPSQIGELKKSKEKFRQAVAEVFKEVVIHGSLMFNRDGEIYLRYQPDLDAKICLGLLKEIAGVKEIKIEYVWPGCYIAGKNNLDTGKGSGIIIKKETDGRITIIIDHHGKHSTPANICTAEQIYLLLEAGGCVEKFLEKDISEKDPEKRKEIIKEKRKILKKVLTFVSRSDRGTYPVDKKEEKKEEEKVFENSYRTIWGLRRFLDFKTLYELFKKGKKPFETLTEKELEEYKLMKARREQEGNIAQSIRELKEIKKQKSISIEEKNIKRFIAETRYGKIIVCVNDRIPGGWDAVRTWGGYDGYIIYNKKNKSFFITVAKGDLSNIAPKFGRGVECIRGTMLIKNPLEVRGEKEKPLIPIEKIIEKLGGKILKNDNNIS